MFLSFNKILALANSLNNKSFFGWYSLLISSIVFALSSSSAIFASLTSSLSVTCISSAYNPYTSSSKLSYSKKLISEIEFPFSVQAKPYFINVKRTLVASTASGKINLIVFFAVGCKLCWVTLPREYVLTCSSPLYKVTDIPE